MIVAPLVDFLGPRLSMAGGSFMYTLFQIGMLFLNEPYLYISSALLGIGSGCKRKLSNSSGSPI